MARIIGVLLICSGIAACSSVRLAYNNLPRIGYWWLDGYLDFDGSQSPRVRDDLEQLLAWHRENELPKIAGLLREAQVLAIDDITPEQVCGIAEEIRTRLVAVAEQAEPAGAQLAMSLGDEQLRQLERKYASTNAKYRDEWLDRTPAQQRQKRYEQFVERSEDFYGRLEPAQRELLRARVAQSVFDPRLVDAQRRERQQDALALLRRIQAEAPPAAETRAAIHAYVLRIARPPPGPERHRQVALQQEACRNVAALHNLASASQRERAVRRLRDYELDVRLLAAR